MARISASGIKDYLSCSKRYQYRRERNSLAQFTPEKIVGNIVHQVLADYWNEPDIVDLAINVASGYNLDTYHENRVVELIKNFKEVPNLWLSESDKIEKTFREFHYSDVEVWGMLDRITEDGLILDWKTTSTYPLDLHKDPQFIVYDWATNGEYRLACVHLDTKQIIWYNRNDFYYNTIINGVIPKMVEDIESGNYVEEGLFRNTCSFCQFKGVCWNELASTKPSTRKRNA